LGNMITEDGGLPQSQDNPVYSPVVSLKPSQCPLGSIYFNGLFRQYEYLFNDCGSVG
jgi:hypothetical protein